MKVYYLQKYMVSKNILWFEEDCRRKGGILPMGSAPFNEILMDLGTELARSPNKNNLSRFP